MKLKYIIAAAVLSTITIWGISCTGSSGDKQSTKQATDSTLHVIDNKDEMTFLRTFLDNYIQLNGKQAQELARKHLTQEFYSNYIENCNNQDNAIDLICEVTLDEKVQRVDTIMKGIEDQSSYIVQVEVKGSDGKPFTAQYDMTVIKSEEGTFKLSDSQVND